MGGVCVNGCWEFYSKTKHNSIASSINMMFIRVIVLTNISLSRQYIPNDL